VHRGQDAHLVPGLDRADAVTWEDLGSGRHPVGLGVVVCAADGDGCAADRSHLAGLDGFGLETTTGRRSDELAVHSAAGEDEAAEWECVVLAWPAEEGRAAWARTGRGGRT